MENKPNDLSSRQADRQLLHTFAQHADWDEHSSRKAFGVAGVYPDKKQWLTWSIRFLAGTGVAFLLAGILFFFAWNWADMSRVFKFGIIGGTMAAVSAAALFLRSKHEFVFQLCITVVAALTGVLFAVHGQEYQTGADSYELFRNWVIAILPLVIIARFSPLWMMYAVLLNVFAVTWNTQAFPRHDNMMLTSMIVANLLIVLVYEIASRTGFEFAKQRWVPRITGAAAVLLLTFAVIVYQGERRSSDDGLISAIMTVPVFLTGIIYYGVKKHELFLPAIIGFGIILILSSFTDDIMGDDGDFVFYQMLFRGFFVIAATSALGVGLVRINKYWKKNENEQQQ